MNRPVFALALFALLTGCAHATPTAVAPTGAPATKAIGCLPGDCPPHPHPTTWPTAQPGCGGGSGGHGRPIGVKAIGCLPGDCPPKPCR